MANRKDCQIVRSRQLHVAAEQIDSLLDRIWCMATGSYNGERALVGDGITKKIPRGALPTMFRKFQSFLQVNQKGRSLFTPSLVREGISEVTK